MFESENCKIRAKTLKAFTLPEILVAVSIFSIVVSIVGNLYVQSFRETRKSNSQNQIYEDARFIMQQIAAEVRDGMIDYDEYYNQKVVMQNYGQNYGRYYSAFFYPGSDEALGYACNDGPPRNRRNCTPIRSTLDRNTGENPYPGKWADAAVAEDALCGYVAYETPIINGSPAGECPSVAPDIPREWQDQLYLISADGFKKTILAREVIGEETPPGATAAEPVHALSLLRLQGYDLKGADGRVGQDGISDTFVCADGFQCRGSDDVSAAFAGTTTTEGFCYTTTNSPFPADLPRWTAGTGATDLSEAPSSLCDTAAGGFSKDFVPVSPFRVNVKELRFFITPSENPHYAFAEESAQIQPRVTILLTVAPNSQKLSKAEEFEEVTLVTTVSSRVLRAIPAPLAVP